MHMLYAIIDFCRIWVRSGLERLVYVVVHVVIEIPLPLILSMT
jgi:hypothetical protein